MVNNQAPKSGSGVQSFMTGLAIGAVVGATLALLYAPKKGSELREDISDTVGDVTQRFRKAVDSVKQAASDIINDGKERGNEMFQQAVAKAESLIDEADRIIADAKSRASVL